VAVSLSIANHHASLPVSYRLYLPKDWADDSKRRRKTGVPEDVGFKTKPEIALEQIAAACKAELRPFECGTWEAACCQALQVQIVAAKAVFPGITGTLGSRPFCPITTRQSRWSPLSHFSRARANSRPLKRHHWVPQSLNFRSRHSASGFASRNCSVTSVSSPSKEPHSRNCSITPLAMMQVTQLVLPHMRRWGGGRIVNMGSLAGKEGLAKLAAYSAASAGVVSFTKALGREIADTNIRVNCVAPGPIDTDMICNLGPDAVNGIISDSPMRRLGDAEEVAHMVAWLCSDASRFNTGAIFDMSGGRARY